MSYFDYINNIKFVSIIEFIGAFAFAVSGIRLSSAKNFDLFGSFVVGFITAVGGGTLRDLLIGSKVFWLDNQFYLWTTFIAIIFCYILRKKMIHLYNTILFFDCIGLGLFVVVGIEKALSFGMPSYIAIIMGTITGAVGGILRDILINEIPLILRKEIYAFACIIGGIAFFCMKSLGINIFIVEISTAFIVILVRFLSFKFKWNLPGIKNDC